MAHFAKLDTDNTTVLSLVPVADANAATESTPWRSGTNGCRSEPSAASTVVTLYTPASQTWQLQSIFVR